VGGGSSSNTRLRCLSTTTQLSVRSLELGKGIVESVRALPASLAQLTALESLCLRDSEVTTLPSFVGLLPCLLDLQLRSNHRLEAVAPEVFSSAAGEQLECLLVNDCSKITAVPEELALCTRLLSCTITQCHLAAVPAGLVTLGRLRHLRLFQNDIAALPDYWSALHLQELDVSGNDLTSLPDAVVTCVSLRVLKAQRNHLAFLPSELGRLAALEEIDVARNVLVALPEAAGLVNLRRLVRAFAAIVCAAACKTTGTALRAADCDACPLSAAACNALRCVAPAVTLRSMCFRVLVPAGGV
jgi:Leucine-rich repeat (LRR) protein